MKIDNTYVISLGGSLIVQKRGIDTDFLKRFKKFILKQVSCGRRFFLVVGGGATCRLYRDAARKVGILTPEDLDWLGVHSTRLNAHLIRTLFQDWVHPVIINNPYEDMGEIKKPIVVAAGWKPGWSTDYDAVALAQKYKADVVINMSNIKMVYDKDPKKFKDAKPIKKINWDELLRIVGGKWTPGMRVPFDPVAAQLAKKIGLRVIVCDGRDLKNLDKILAGKQFVGTVIE